MVKICNHLKIAHINVRAILPKIHVLRNYIISSMFDIIAMSETWLTKLVPDNIIDIDGFRVVRRDREEGRGGGILFYVRNSINFAIIGDMITVYSEQLWINAK